MVERFDEGMEFKGVGRKFEDCVNWEVGNGKDILF